MRADIIVYDGVDELDAIGPLEVLRSAALAGADVSARLVTRAPQEIVTGSHGLRLIPDGVFAAGEADVILVAGGGWIARSEAGAWGEVVLGEWPRLLAGAAAEAQTIASVCTGTMLLAHAGVIGNRRATTHHAAWDDLAATGATLVKDRVVDDGDLVTSGGVTSGIDLALWLVEREFGAELAERLATRLEYPRARPRASRAAKRP